MPLFHLVPRTRSSVGFPWRLGHKSPSPCERETQEKGERKALEITKKQQPTRCWGTASAPGQRDGGMQDEVSPERSQKNPQRLAKPQSTHTRGMQLSGDPTVALGWLQSSTMGYGSTMVRFGSPQTMAFPAKLKRMIGKVICILNSCLLMSATLLASVGKVHYCFLVDWCLQLAGKKGERKSGRD